MLSAAAPLSLDSISCDFGKGLRKNLSGIKADGKE